MSKTGNIVNFQQLYELKKERGILNQLWREHKELYDFTEKARMYALITGKGEAWTKWWEENQLSIGFPVINKFFKELKFIECDFCGNPFPQGRRDNKYCSHNCRIYASRRKKKVAVA